MRSTFHSPVFTADTENNTLVRNYIVSTLKALNWHIELDEFTGQTPIGQKHFVNVIATKNPTASRRVVLSAHFDSKYFPHYPQNQVSPIKYAFLKVLNDMLTLIGSL